jgi:hypothetical protein
MTTFRHDVRYLEEMRPEYVVMASEDLNRVARVIESGLPALDSLLGNVQWDGDAHALYEQRLSEAVELVECWPAATAERPPPCANTATPSKPPKISSTPGS